MNRKIINGHDAEISNEYVALSALDAAGCPILSVRSEILDGRVTKSAVRSFALRVGAAKVLSRRSFQFMYSTPWEMSYTRGTRTFERVYAADGAVLSSAQETRGY